VGVAEVMIKFNRRKKIYLGSVVGEAGSRRRQVVGRRVMLLVLRHA
jgi:hypothetical protein